MLIQNKLLDLPLNNLINEPVTNNPYFSRKFVNKLEDLESVVAFSHNFVKF